MAGPDVSSASMMAMAPGPLVSLALHGDNFPASRLTQGCLGLPGEFGVGFCRMAVIACGV